MPRQQAGKSPSQAAKHDRRYERRAAQLATTQVLVTSGLVGYIAAVGTYVSETITYWRSLPSHTLSVSPDMPFRSYLVVAGAALLVATTVWLAAASGLVHRLRGFKVRNGHFVWDDDPARWSPGQMAEEVATRHYALQVSLWLAAADAILLVTFFVANLLGSGGFHIKFG